MLVTLLLVIALLLTVGSATYPAKVPLWAVVLLVILILIIAPFIGGAVRP